MPFSKEERKKRQAIARKKYYYKNRILKPKLSEEERKIKYRAARKRADIKNKVKNTLYKKQYYLKNKELIKSRASKYYYDHKATNISGETCRTKKVKKEIPKVSIQTNIILMWV